MTKIPYEFMDDSETSLDQEEEAESSNTEVYFEEEMISSGRSSKNRHNNNHHNNTNNNTDEDPSESENMSTTGWSDRDDATSTENTSSGNNSHTFTGVGVAAADFQTPVHYGGGGGGSTRKEAAPPASRSSRTSVSSSSAASSSSSRRKRKKKKTKKKKKDEPDGYHGREIDMDFVKEAGKEHYRILREAQIKAEEEALARETALAKRASSSSTSPGDNDNYDDSSNSISTMGKSNTTDQTIDFRNDPLEEMTLARRFALRLYKKKWYRRLANGSADDVDRFHNDDLSPVVSSKHKRKYGFEEQNNNNDDEDKPSLARAWAYFEHVALDRYIVDESEEMERKTPKGLLGRIRQRFFAGERELRRAAPGTKDVKTRLFDPFNTPHSQLGNFGIAVGLYFSTVRVVGLICLIAGIINSYSMWYFASDDYMSEEARNKVPYFLQGSAICTDTSWVFCPECNCTDDPLAWESRKQWETDRCASYFDNETQQELTFALKNNCDATVWQVAAMNYASILFIMIAIFLLGKHLEHAEVIFDEDQQTAQDYSIVITNPPPDATDPEEWRNFFRDQCDGAKVTVCTCALDNDLLVQALVKRRETLRSIRNALPPHTPLDLLSIAQIAAQRERERGVMESVFAKIIPDIPENFAYLVVMNARIQALAQLKYNTTRVFISFEREQDQRHVLSTLSVGSFRAKHNVKSALPDPKYLFRGKYVLNVEKATEPNTIHWSSLNVSAVRKVRQQLLTTFITLIGIVGVAMIVRYVNEWSTVLAALTISAFNAGFPEAAKIIVLLESHDNEGSKQRSLFFKIAAFRWVNTAIVISLITPFTATITLDGGLIPQAHAIFVSEILTLNIIQLADGYGHFRRLVVAPLMRNQDAMNLWFRGEEVELAERYTNMTKIFFLALWYSSVYPGAFFMAAVALFINYFTDRFGIMRTWKRAAHLGSEVSAISRKYFFSLANIGMAFISAYYWAGFPFDNLCDTGEDIALTNSNVTGNYTIVPDPESDPETSYDVTVSPGDSIYKYCSQDMFDGFSFPFIPAQQEERGDWMTPTQEQITTIFGWSSLGVIFVVIFRMLKGILKGYLKSRIGWFKAIGEVQNINFSDVPLISTYIPQVDSWMFSYPLVVCDSDKFRKSLFDWEDPEKPHAFYDLTKDAELLMKDDEWFNKTKCFSQVRYWRPEDDDDDDDDENDDDSDEK